MALVAAVVAGCGGEPGPPDLLLLTVDTLRADRLGAYGHAGAETPEIDALAARGVRFTQAITPLPRTTPALASLLTGLAPHRHGSREVGQPIAPGVPLVAELLAARGFTTLGVSANGAAGRRPGLARGFERFVDAEELAGEPSDRRASEVTAAALALLAAAPAEKPLLLWAHYVDPHAPYEPPAPWGDRPAGEGCRRMMAEVAARGWPVGHVFSDRDGVASRARDSCLALYDGEIAHVDAEIGRLLAGYRRLRGTGREPLVILTADHGENFGEDGLYFQHGPNVHDASLRVPLVVAGPGIGARVDDGAVTLEDLAPTLLALAGVAAGERPPGDGVDLGPRLAGESDGSIRVLTAESGSALMVHNFLTLHSGRAQGFHCLNGPRYSLCGGPDEEPRLYDREADPELTVEVGERFPRVRRRLAAARKRWPAEQARERAVRTPRYKLVERPRREGGYRRALYDLEADPGATTDARTRLPVIAARLGAVLDRFGAALPREASPARTPEQLEALRALGYLD